jgi:anti-sigma regulatory factor (Ser/Thr protein kinase)
MKAPEEVLHFRVRPEPRASRAVRAGVAQFGREHGVSDDDLDLFLTALGEAIANAVEHGARNSRAVSIDVEVRIGGDRIIGHVQDDGDGFTPPSVAEPSLPDATSERGRGLPIIRRCSDFFAVTSSPGKGTAVLLGRYFRPEDDVADVAC